MPASARRIIGVSLDISTTSDKSFGLKLSVPQAHISSKVRAIKKRLIPESPADTDYYPKSRLVTRFFRARHSSKRPTAKDSVPSRSPRREYPPAPRAPFFPAGRPVLAVIPGGVERSAACTRGASVGNHSPLFPSLPHRSFSFSPSQILFVLSLTDPFSFSPSQISCAPSIRAFCEWVGNHTPFSFSPSQILFVLSLTDLPCPIHSRLLRMGGKPHPFFVLSLTDPFRSLPHRSPVPHPFAPFANGWETSPLFRSLPHRSFVVLSLTDLLCPIHSRLLRMGGKPLTPFRSLPHRSPVPHPFAPLANGWETTHPLAPQRSAAADPTPGVCR